MQDAIRRARISMAEASDRPGIYAMRHAVYAAELGQHAVNGEGLLSDPLDTFNEYVVAHIDGHLAGFISITPPGHRYSVDKYVRREELPVAFDEGLYELRVLTVAEEHRSSRLAAALMYAAFRWAEEQGATQVIAMGRSEVAGLYRKYGLRDIGLQVQCGAVSFEMLHCEIGALRSFVERQERFYTWLLGEVSWELEVAAIWKEANIAPVCFHGGAFFEAIGAGFETLEKRREIVSADVLDAWFPPSPKVLETLHEHLEWLLRTSPPTHCEGLRAAIGRNRGVEENRILVGGGSSDLIYMAFQHWLKRGSRVLILDPMYGEYAHVLEKVIGCEVYRLRQTREQGYAVDLEELAMHLQRGYDMVVLVNPNNPTGRHISRARLEAVLAEAPARTRVWIDEAYLEYVGTGESLERFAARSRNVIVCKTMSKVYALSGARVGYLCAGPHQIAEMMPLTPPWAVGLAAQVAAVRALEDEPYYAMRYRETHALRAEMIAGLERIGVREIVPSSSNFILFHLEPEHAASVDVVRMCRERGVFFRDISRMGTDVGERTLRTAVKDRGTNERILATLGSVLSNALGESFAENAVAAD